MESRSESAGEIRQKLLALGAERLADELLRLAERDQQADAVLTRLLDPPEELAQSVRRGIAGLKRSRKFIDWDESDELELKLEDLLEDILSLQQQPELALELVADFLRTDQATFSRCDDSSGIIGSIYSIDAVKLFIRMAKLCADRRHPARVLTSLFDRDEWGIRLSVADHAEEFLDEELMQWCIAQLQERAVYNRDSYVRDPRVYAIETLACQLRDTELLEFTMRRSRRELFPIDKLKLAQLYFARGEAQTAWDWLEQIPQPAFNLHDRDDELRLLVLDALGRKAEQVKLAQRMLAAEPGLPGLERLLAALPQEERDAVRRKELDRAAQGRNWSCSSALFLLEAGEPGMAARYTVERHEQVDGAQYHHLRVLADGLEPAGELLATAVCYRALLDSILERKYSKAYPYAAKYLLRLNALAEKIGDWQGLPDHGDYKLNLRVEHGKKRSFWQQYAERGGGE
ncbi:MAG: hypothetical protein R3F46_04360 [bacterium]